MVRRLTGVIALAALCCSLHAAAAQAGGTLTRVGTHMVAGIDHVAGPAFAGSGFAWATPAEKNDGYVVGLLRDGTYSSQHLKAGGSDANAGVERTAIGLAASADTYAFGVDVQSCHDESGCKYQFYDQVESKLFAGPLGQAPTFTACGGGGYEPHESIDLDGQTVAYLDGCARRAAVRDLSGDPDAASQLYPVRDQVRLAGSYLAVSTGDEVTEQYPESVVVYNWRTGETLYEVKPPGGVASFDLRDDGTLAFTRAAEGGPSALLWASPQEPAEHKIATVDAPLGDVRIAGSRVAVRDARLFRVFELDGREVASTSAGDAVGTTFDFDGGRLVFAAEPCEALWMETWDLARGAPSLPAGRCPHARPASGRAVVHLDTRRVHVAVTCPASPALGCSGSWGAQVLPLTTSYYSENVALAPGETRTLRFALLRSEACAYARGRVRRTILRLAPGFTRRRPARGGPGRLTKVRIVGRAQGCAKR
jgi:hypothetical protein